MNIEKLIVSGYFPEELLPVFTAEDLKKVISDVLLVIDTLDPIARNKKPKLSHCLPFSIPKAGGYRRSLSIPNPLHYIRISQTIADNWPLIINHTEKSTISVSRLTPGTTRAIAKPNFEEFINGRIIQSVGNRFLLKIDISRFYKSIYTHSIPWALHTKAVSKGKPYPHPFIWKCSG